MIIGIDFDNTIANYNHLFEKVAYNNKFIKNKFYISKNSVKKILLDPNTNAGIKKWQTIQGQVYGKYMNQAKVYSGLNKFLIYCKYRKVKVFIISHKSKFGHFDKEKISLRKEAVKLFAIKEENLECLKEPHESAAAGPSRDHRGRRARERARAPGHRRRAVGGPRAHGAGRGEGGFREEPPRDPRARAAAVQHAPERAAAGPHVQEEGSP